MGLTGTSPTLHPRLGSAASTESLSQSSPPACTRAITWATRAAARPVGRVVDMACNKRAVDYRVLDTRSGSCRKTQKRLSFSWSITLRYTLGPQPQYEGLRTTFLSEVRRPWCSRGHCCVLSGCYAVIVHSHRRGAIAVLWTWLGLVNPWYRSLNE